MQKITLAMIVRDAEAHVERCIASALPLISRYTIIDTGSTDRTKELVAEALKDVPGQLLDSEWQGFAHNRSELLTIASHGSEWVLMLDADMELVVEGDLPELTADSYLITIRDRGLEYPLPLLTKASLPFYYAGVAHSYLACATPATESVLLRELAIEDRGGGGNRPGKIERDRDLLRAEVAKNPTDRRSWFYLAQSYRDLDQIDEAIGAYKFRASLGGWDEEVYNALHQAGVLLCEHRNAKEGIQLLLDAWLLKPGRAEALRALSNVAANVADKIPFPEDDVLFVRRSAYTYQPPEPKPLPEVVPPLEPRLTRRPRITKRRGLNPRDVTAIIVTRGNVSLDPILEALPPEYEVVVWNNAEREHDYRCFGRYAAVPEATRPVLFWVDDDVIFRNHDALLRAYEPGVLVCNMDKSWFGSYQGRTRLVGAGSLCDADLPAQTWATYREHYPFDEEVLLFGDHAFGILTPSKVVDLGYELREFAGAPDRLYLQPGSEERKWNMIQRAQALHVQLEARAA